MFHRACTTLLVASLAFARTLVGQAEVIDGIAAVVNKDVITYSQVRELIGARERALRATLQGEELANQIKEIRFAALKDLIDRQLILQEFKKRDSASRPTSWRIGFKPSSGRNLVAIARHSSARSGVRATR